MRSRLVFVGLVLAACHDNNGVNHILDAPPGQRDATPADAPADGIATGSASVTVTNGTVGKLGLTVYFQGADSTLDSTATTDASGTATGVVSANGFATVIIPGTNGGADELVTWNLVNPGDHEFFDLGATTTVQTYTFVVPTISPYTSYSVETTCGTAPLTVQVAAEFPATVAGSASLAGCDGPQDIEVLALDGNMQVQESFFVKAVTMTGGTTVSLVNNAYTAAITHTYQWNNFAEANPLNVYDAVRSASGTTFTCQPAASGTPPTASCRTPALATGQLDVVEASLSDGLTSHAMYGWGQGAAYVGDWGDALLGNFSATPTFSAATAQITWTVTGGGAQANMSLGAVTVSRSSDMHTWTWGVVGGGSSLQLPTLPTTLYNWNIASTDAARVTIVRLFDVPGDLDAARGEVVGTNGLASLETGASGVLSTAQASNLQNVVRSARLPF